MGRFVIRRLLQTIPIFFGVTFLVYFLVSALGSPLDTLSPQQKRNPEYTDFLTQQFNLDDPFIVQYLKYIGGVFTGDLGTTFSGESVTDIVITRMPVTATLAGTAIVFELVLGITIGVIAARRQGKFFDNASLVLALVFIAIPVFVLAFALQWLFGIKLGWIIPTGVSEGWPLGYLLPAFVLAAGSLAAVIRITRDSLRETFNLDFIRTARAKGLPAGTILRRYGLRNSLIPVVVFLGVDFGALMAGAVITEGIFNVPGIGQQLYSSIKQQEAVVIVGIVTIFVIIIQLLSLLVDVLVAILDPRVRYE